MINDSFLSVCFSSDWIKILKKILFLCDRPHVHVLVPFDFLLISWVTNNNIMLTVLSFDMLIVLINLAPNVGMAFLLFHI